MKHGLEVKIFFDSKCEVIDKGCAKIIYFDSAWFDY